MNSPYSYCIDSGCTPTHMTPDKPENFQRFDSPITVTLANNQETQATGKGSITLTENNGNTLKLDDSLHVPDLNHGLVSVSALTCNNMDVSFADSCEITDTAVGGVKVVSSGATAGIG